MKNTTISFIGGGNMTGSLVGGLVADGLDPDRIWVSDPAPGQREGMRAKWPVHCTADNLEAAGHGDLLVLAVKPQMARAVCEELAPTVQQNRPLVVSIAAGLRAGDLSRWLGGDVALVRSMPNTPALVQSGATALCANSRVSREQRDLAETVLRAAGLTLWVEDEALMDAVTALSGSGPAYFFLVMEAMEAAGRELGLNEKTARLLTLQTAFGAAKMALESSEDAATLRQRVTSPGGTTERALEVLEREQLRSAFREAMVAARDRSRELAELLGRD